MKKALLLFTFGVLSVVACRKTFVPGTPTKDASLEGESVNVA